MKKKEKKKIELSQEELEKLILIMAQYYKNTGMFLKTKKLYNKLFTARYFE